MSWLEAVLRWLRASERRLASDGFLLPRSRMRWAVALWIVGLVAVSAMVLITKFPPIWDYMGDPLMLLDAGWRVWHGQVPHRDFYSAIGPFPLGVFGASFALGAQDVAGFPRALLLAGLLASAGAWVISRGRLAVWWRLVFSLLALLLPVAPVYLGAGGGPPFGSLHHTTYAMVYNRLGWCAFVLQMLLMLLPPRTEAAPRSAFWEAVLGGALLALGVFCKINFLIAALALGIYWLAIKPNVARAAGLLAGACGVVLLLAIYPGGMLEYFHDQARLLAVERSESYAQKLLLRFHANLPWVVLLPAVHLWLLTAVRPEAARAARWLTLHFFVALGLSLFITTFNVEGGELPGLVVAALITVEMAGRSLAADGALEVARPFIAKACAALLALSYLCFDATSLAYATLWKLRKPAWAQESEALPGRLAIIPIPLFFNEPAGREAAGQAVIRRRSGPWQNTGTEVYMTPRQTVRWINDGVALLAPLAGPGDRLFVADWYNPFNLALGLPPAKGGATLWDHGRMVDARTHPDPTRALAEVTLFLVPKRPHLAGQPEFMLPIYGRHLERDFTRAGESALWTCWRRRAPAAD